MLAPLQLVSPLTLSQAWPSFSNYHNVPLMDIKRFLTDVMATIVDESTQTATPHSPPLNAGATAHVLAFISRVLYESAQHHKTQQSVGDAVTGTDVTSDPIPTRQAIEATNIRTLPTPPTSEDESEDVKPNIKAIEQVDTSQEVSPSLGHCGGTSAWRLTDYFEFRESDRAWHCLHPACERASKGGRRLGVYTAPRYGVSGIRKRAEEHSRKHSWGRQQRTSQGTRWWRNGEQVKPRSSDRKLTSPITTILQSDRNVANLHSPVSVESDEEPYYSKYQLSSMRCTLEPPSEDEVKDCAMASI